MLGVFPGGGGGGIELIDPLNNWALKLTFLENKCLFPYISPTGFDPPKIACAKPLGMESKIIPNSALKSSSDYNQYFGPERSRLHMKQEGSYYGGWASKHVDVGQWLEIDLGKITKVTRIATQGRYDANWWVTKYTLTYSDGGKYKSYKNGEVC